MYNLTAATAHTFYVGQGQWLVHNCPDFESIASQIAGGHAKAKHLPEFLNLGITIEQDLAQLTKNVMENAAGRDVKILARGRTAYWDSKSGTAVIHDPASPDGGTVFRPKSGRSYFDNLPTK